MASVTWFPLSEHQGSSDSSAPPGARGSRPRSRPARARRRSRTPRDRGVLDRRRARAGRDLGREPRAPGGALESLEPWCSLSGNQVTLAMAGYGFVASVLPVWLLLCPRDYLSSFLKI